eukprot:7452314-Alexandrium_andersonii.AAC.1
MANAIAHQSERIKDIALAARSQSRRPRHQQLGPREPRESPCQQAHGFFVDSALPVPAQVLLRLDSRGARLGEYTWAAEGVLDGLPPRDRDSGDHFVPFFEFGVKTETGSDGLVVHAERIGK